MLTDIFFSVLFDSALSDLFCGKTKHALHFCLIFFFHSAGCLYGCEYGRNDKTNGKITGNLDALKVAWKSSLDCFGSRLFVLC